MYFLILFFYDKQTESFRNVNLVGYWPTHAEADKVLQESWPNIHEYWCNSARIEHHQVGFLGRKSKERWFYHTEDIHKTPELQAEPKALQPYPNLFL